MYDVIIIGAGPAGISAGIYVKRANLKVLILYYGESGIEKASRIENYYGFPEGITGKELYNKGIEQAKKIGIEVKKQEITNIEINSHFLFIVKSNKEQFETKSIIIATGSQKIKPNIIRH